ncbi:porin [Caballeronia choica]|jgi:general bacterial porin, GBP family|uniref:Porin n=1 Tax=Caballeronia choica TaxID=326476 RepID=A0A158KY42_9BURK|nr:porin [Caballeronia choica]SAL86076.1 porin [Caballeronia choica]
MKRIRAVLATLIPFACVQAQNNIAAFGILHASATTGSEGGGTPNVKRLESGVGPGSRLGFRGMEDLGAGLSAIFDTPKGLSTDTGKRGQGALAWGRQIYVALASTTGWRVTAGRQYWPADLAPYDADAIRQVYWGSTSGEGGGVQQSPKSGVGDGCRSYSARLNSLVISTASSRGFAGRLPVGAGDESAQGSDRFVRRACARLPAIAAINTMGSLAGFGASNLMGYDKQHTGNFNLGLIVITGFLLLVGLVALAFPARAASINEVRQPQRTTAV